MNVSYLFQSVAALRVLRLQPHTLKTQDNRVTVGRSTARIRTYYCGLVVAPTIRSAIAGLNRLRKDPIYCHPVEHKAAKDRHGSLKLRLRGFFASLRMIVIKSSFATGKGGATSKLKLGIIDS